MAPGKQIIFLFCSLCLLLFMPVITIADTIFSDLGTSPNVYQLASGEAVTGSLASSNFPSQTLAIPFTVPSGSDFNLTEVDIGLTFFNSEPEVTNNPVVGLFIDSGGLPGTLIGTGGGGVIPDFLSTSTKLLMLPATGIVLDAGTTYWLAIGPPDGTTGLHTFDVWNDNSTGVTGTYADSADGGTTWTTKTLTLGAFDILGTPITSGDSNSVPEPSSLVLLGMGLAALGVRGKWKHTTL